MHLLLTLVLSAAPAAAPHPPVPPPFDQVLAEAAKAGTPILLDVVTTWCHPCQTMAAEVFPHPKVQKALEGLRFVSYDAERGPGVEVAQRFHIDSYPTVLLLTPDGVKAGQLQQQSVDAFVAELELLKPLGRVRGTGEPAPDAPPAAWYLAGVAAAPNDPARALAAFQHAVAADPRNAQGLASRAAFASIPLKADQASHLARAKALADLLATWPGSAQAPSALKELAGLVHKDGLDRNLLEGARARVVQASLASSSPEALNDLIYLLLAQGDLADARAVAARLEGLAPEDAETLDTVAEVAFRSGERARAVAVSKKAVSLAKPADRAELAQNLARFEKEDPPDAGAEEPQPENDVFAAIREAEASLARAERAAGTKLLDACPRPNTKANAIVRVWFDKDVKVTRAVAFDPQAPASLLRCLEKAALGISLPALHVEPWADLPVNYPGPAGH